MKILYLYPTLNVGGAEKLLVQYLIGLKHADQDVYFVQQSYQNSFLDKKLKEAKIENIYLTKLGNSIFGKVKRKIVIEIFDTYFTKKMINKINPDVIHFHGFRTDFKKLNLDYRKCFLTFHTSVDRAIEINGGQNALLSMRYAVEEGMTLIAINQKIYDDLKKYFPKSNIQYIQNGVDVKEIQAKRLDKKEFLNKLGLDEKCFVLGHVGRFHKVKNHERIIDIFSKLNEKNKNSVLLLVGSGEKNRIEKIRKVIRDKRLEDKVFLLGERADATLIMSVMDAFVMPSFTEGFSIVVCEAQAQGVRCVVSDAIVEETLVNNNCFRISLEESDDVWVKYLLGDFTQDSSRSIMELDISNSIDKHIKAYERG